jgi:hypothetical protein
MIDAVSAGWGTERKLVRSGAAGFAKCFLDRRLVVRVQWIRPKSHALLTERPGIR